MRKAITTLTALIILILFVQGWRNGQLPNNPNPTAKNCQNAGCHAGNLQESSISIELLSGNNTNWSQGTNAIIIRPIIACDTLGGGKSPDSLFTEWGYTMNFTSCTGGPIPISVSLHSCSGGSSYRYQSNGIWYAEIGTPAPLVRQNVPGMPANITCLSAYCIISFVMGSYPDSIKVNIGAVFSNGDSIPGNDSTIFYSVKLGPSNPLTHEPFTGGLSSPFHIHPLLLKCGLDGLSVYYTGRWRIVSAAGVVVASGTGNREQIHLQTGAYYLQAEGENLITTKAIFVR